MNKFNSKVIFVDNQAIDKNMNMLSILCKDLTDLVQEYYKVVGHYPSLETVNFLLANEHKNIYSIVQHPNTILIKDQSHSVKSLGLSQVNPSESLIYFIKEAYVRQHATEDITRKA